MDSTITKEMRQIEDTAESLRYDVESLVSCILHSHAEIADFLDKRDQDLLDKSDYERLKNVRYDLGGIIQEFEIKKG